MWFVYMLLCDGKTFYVGITKDLVNRYRQHRSRNSFFTKKFSQVRLVYCEQYQIEKEAVTREKQIKGWSRAKKQMLVDGKLGLNVCTGFAGALLTGREVYPERS